MNRSSGDVSSPNLLTLDHPCTVCCGRQLPANSTRKLEALILFKALYIFVANFTDESATSLPAFSAWYKSATESHSGLYLALHTCAIDLTVQDLDLFSNFSTLTYQIDFSTEELATEELYLASIEKSIQFYLSLNNKTVTCMITRLEDKEKNCRIAIREAVKHITELERISQFTKLRR